MYFTIQIIPSSNFTSSLAKLTWCFNKILFFCKILPFSSLFWIYFSSSATFASKISFFVGRINGVLSKLFLTWVYNNPNYKRVSFSFWILFVNYFFILLTFLWSGFKGELLHWFSISNSYFVFFSIFYFKVETFWTVFISLT